MVRERRFAITTAHKVLPSVRRSLAQLKAEDKEQDAGLRTLAEVYATAIDQAAEMATAARQVVDKVDDPNDPLEAPKRLMNALVKFAEGVAVLEQLGPKLQIALESLGASPRARAAMTKTPGGGSKPDADAGKPEPTSLERRRLAAAERAANARTPRAHGSATVDPSA